MAKKQKEEAVIEESDSPESIAKDFLKEHEEDHYNFEEEVDYKISTGSLNLDIALDGGMGPGFHRFAGHNSAGKLLLNTVKVLTTNGWKEVGSLNVGEFVYGSDGLPKKVLGVYPQKSVDYYKVTFNDGSFTFCSMDHLWYTETLLDRHAKRKGTVKTLEQISKSLNRILNSSSSKSGKIDQCNHAIPYIKPIQFPKKEFYIHPYVLGVLLGDGSFCGDGVSLANSQDDVIDRLSKFLPNNVDLTERARKEGVTEKQFYFNGISITKNPFTQEMNRLGLLGKNFSAKFIPEEYLFSDIESRIWLLRGLLDTDAWLDKRKRGLVEYNTGSDKLADDITDLARSLGARVTRSIKKAPKFKYKGEIKTGAPSHGIRISMDNPDLIPISSVKRQAQYQTTVKNKARCIKSVEKAGNGDCTCIKVNSEDSLFVIENYLLTHNTPSTLEIQANFLRQHMANNIPCRGLYIRAEGRFSKENMERTGMAYTTDPEKWTNGAILVLNCQKYEVIVKFLKKLFGNNPNKILYSYIIDSMDGLKVKADEGKEFDQNAKVAGAPALSKRFLSEFSLEMNIRGHQGLLISQVTAEIKIDPYAKTTPRDGSFSGGNALSHYSNITLEFNKYYAGDLILDNPNGKVNDGKTEVLGHWCKVTIRKSLNEKNYINIAYPIKHGVKGRSAVWVEYEIVDQLIKWEMVSKAGSWLKLSPTLEADLKENGLEMPSQIQGVDKLRSFLEENPKVTEYLYKKFRDTLAALKS